MLSQKEGVFQAIVELFNFSGKGKFTPTKDQRKQIVEMVTAGIMDGNIEFSEEAQAKYPTSKDVSGYVTGMVSNWLRKDTRLNDSETYVAKNPGSRTGSGDEMLKNLKALRTQLSDKDKIAKVDEAIENRKSELQAAKAKSVTINVDAIPEELRHLIPQA
jgi:hypothetical protein